ncbi:MAG: hypothetical protein ACTSUO_00185 [Candidatus Thorarchaeota archaeon]
MTDETPRIRYYDRAMKLSKTTAMNTLLYFIRKGAKVLPEKYEQSLVLWEEVTKKRIKLTKVKDPDRFVPVCDAEKYLRKNLSLTYINPLQIFLVD